MARFNRTKLSNVKLDEISFVGKGDNPEANVIILKMKKDPTESSIIKLGKEYKAEDKNKVLLKWLDDNKKWIEKGTAQTFDQIVANEEIRDQVWDMVWTLEDSISSIMNDPNVTDKAAMIQQSVDEFKAAITPITKGEEIMPEKMKKDLEDAGVKITGLEKQVNDLTEENKILKAAPAAGETCKTCGQKMAVKKEDEEVLKGLPESIQKEMKENRERIAKMEDDNLNREYISKAAGLPLVGKSDDLGAILKSIAKIDPAVAEKVLDIFKVAQTRIAEGDLLKEKGTTDTNAGNTAQDKLMQKAKEYRAAHPEVTIEKAYQIVFDTEHDLRKQYNEERSK